MQIDRYLISYRLETGLTLMSSRNSLTPPALIASFHLLCRQFNVFLVSFAYHRINITIHETLSELNHSCSSSTLRRRITLRQGMALLKGKSSRCHHAHISALVRSLSDPMGYPPISGVSVCLSDDQSVRNTSAPQSRLCCSSGSKLPPSPFRWQQTGLLI
ncbi:unnamed protein product [Microthlaspi erraticum]|uniref:Uncharacterized protein n=1 Tax=Microthlaspi erraticum TaxID=1685480 RepID=A0A6D2J6Q0_9BRAS|nr:unnamed protein product [Microthlaspi erraticum]